MKKKLTEDEGDGRDKKTDLCFCFIPCIRSIPVNFSLRPCVLASLRLILPLFFLTLPISAQMVSGTVIDAQNAPISNAEVNLINHTESITQTRTDANGNFSIDLNGTQNSLLL